MDLIEVIVSSYDSMYRDDLIQESSLRIHYALPFFDPTISNLHNYFTTVINNICRTYLRKQGRYSQELDIDLQLIGGLDYIRANDEDILSKMIERNRKRFPSVPVDIIDDITEYIYYCLVSNTSKRDTIFGIVSTCGINKNEASSIYVSSLIYLRVHYKEFAAIDLNEYDEEFSIIPDLQELFGNTVADTISKAFTNMYIKFP
jgi:hypothetical protein